ncbi:MAG: UDP-N-acetylmuramoyl-L-alanyl-D-glutamate--2,6-diaminopimelate ligase, partial [Promicromonosporaceae bacterium]|nr:UDP-N-acetylmuramoyl-L-alanyl-D-glutamate--2,6-diaminopimelate ligase [Promicromonosporaceae bacterium]
MTTPTHTRPAAAQPWALQALVERYHLRAGGSTAVQVTGVASDNRVVTLGDLFVALPGSRVHGATFAADAISRGAVAILTDEAGAALLGEGAGVPVLVAPDPRRVVGPIAADIHGQPARSLTTFGVTGTNGKTTVTYLLDAINRALGQVTGLIGTVEMRSGGRTLPSKLTTPEAADLQSLLAAMRDDGVQSLAMEVSSHSLALGRVDGLRFDVAGFTNLTQDHLDFHGTMENYFAAKAELFTPERARHAVVMIDDDWGRRLASTRSLPTTTVTTKPATPAHPATPPATWTVTEITAAGLGSAFTLSDKHGVALRTSVNLPGEFNVANAALACAMVLASGVSVEQLQVTLDQAGGIKAEVPGRMEVISAADPQVIVDFAHNTEALQLALAATRHTTVGGLVVVFGA